jgi:hypothetical protein
MRLRSQLTDSKKAELSASTWLALIIIIITTILAIYYITKIKSTLQGAADGDCAAAVANAAQVNKLYGREYAVNIKGCNTKNLAIVRNEYSDDNNRAKEQIKRRIANEMYLCWKQWGYGQYDLYNESGNYCYPCATISLDAETKTLFGSKIEGMGEHLRKSKIGDRTYQEILAGYSSNEAEKNDKLTQVNWDVPTEKDLALLFTYSKQRESDTVRDFLENKLGIDIEPTEAAAAGSIAGAGVGGAMASGGLLVWNTAAGSVASATGGLSALVGISEVGALTAGGVVTLGVVAGASAGLIATYGYARITDNYVVSSAIYLTQSTPESYYANNCKVAASLQVSP